MEKTIKDEEVSEMLMLLVLCEKQNFIWDTETVLDELKF